MGSRGNENTLLRQRKDGFSLWFCKDAAAVHCSLRQNLRLPFTSRKLVKWEPARALVFFRVEVYSSVMKWLRKVIIKEEFDFICTRCFELGAEKEEGVK